MPGNLDPVPRAELGKNLPFSFLDFSLDNGNFLLEFDANRVVLGVFFKLFELPLQFHDGLLEIKLMFHH
jgi:hypothetical protein